MLSLSIDTFIDIQASAAEVWAQLIDFPSYPEWNPMLTSVDSKAELGASVNFRAAMSNRSLKLKAKINLCESNRALRWKGGIPLLLQGEHYFRLEQLTPETIRFHHGENFQGLMLPLLSSTLIKEGPALYRSMNTALKQRVEVAP